MGKKAKKPSNWTDIDGGAAFVIPYTLLRHSNFKRIGPFTCKLILDLGKQYTGFNNGFLCASWSLMQDQGWNSPVTLSKAVAEAEHYQLIVRTQQGGLNRPNLHAFTWRRIDEKAGRHLDMQPTIKPTDAWKVEQPVFTISYGEAGRYKRQSRLKNAA